MYGDDRDEWIKHSQRASHQAGHLHASSTIEKNDAAGSEMVSLLENRIPLAN